MDKQDYLNQISATSKPLKQGKKGIFSSIYFKLGVGTAVAFIALMIIGSILSGGKGGVQQDAVALKLHLDYTIGAISTYQVNVKSSVLRSSSSSLYGILSNTNNSLTSYLENTYKDSLKKVNTELKNQADAEGAELYTTLFNAKINGILDRVYAHKMTYEISMIMTREESLRKQTNDDTLLSIIDLSYNSLDNLYSQFNVFSETK